MTTYSISTVVNIDTLASKAGADIYNIITGGYLTVDQDSRYGTNQNTSAAMGNITFVATGGGIEFNSSKVRLIQYTGGSGTVPAYDTVISKSGASGKLLTVTSALNAAPVAPGGSMPASGYIKIRQWNGISYTSGALTGITATSSGADTAGFLQIVGVDAKSVTTIYRLNTFKMQGDWFYLGTTSGSSATTYQIPNNGDGYTYCPGVYVESGVGTGVYQFYPCAGSQTALIANIATDEVRGRFCWVKSTTGQVTFGNDGTNSTGGFVPGSGRNIRVPNLFFVNCAAATPTINELPAATPGNRYTIFAIGGGALQIDKVCLNWFLSIDQCFSIALTNTAIMTAFIVSECASPIAWSQVGVGQEAANSQFALTMTLCFAGGTMDSCVWTRAGLAASGNFITTWTDCSGFTITNERNHSLSTVRGNANTGVQLGLRLNNSTWTNTTVGGGRVFLTTCSNLTYTNTIYYDCPSLTTVLTIPMYIFDIFSNCDTLKFDGITFGGLALVQPYSGILGIEAAGCSNINLRNLGTYSSPLDLGGARVDDVGWTQATTTATVTSNGHGLKVGDIIYVVISSNVAIITVASKTLTAATTNTFSFACTTGSTTGTLSYYPTMSANLFVLAASAAANTVNIKRCYTPHTRTNLFTCDNSSKNILLESVMGDFINVPLPALLNGTIKQIFASPSLAAQSSCYGTHWIDYFSDGYTPNKVLQSWSRVTTVATVTSVGHMLRTGDFISDGYSSNIVAIVPGTPLAAAGYAVTGITSSTFSFTCVNSGTTAGTMTFEPLTSRIAIQMNEATAQTTGDYTIDDGYAAFTSAGTLNMASVGDQITFTTPYYILGHTGFPVAEMQMVGGTIADYDGYYAIDKNDGNGFSAFKNLYYTRSGGGGTSGLTNVTMTNTTGVAINDYIWGTGIGGAAQVQSITNTTTIVVTKANTAAVSGVLRFNQLPNETGINPSLGIQLKIRLTAQIAGSAAISSISIFTSSTPTSRAYQYPLDLVPITITVTDTLGNPIQNARVAIFLTSSGTNLTDQLTDINGDIAASVTYTSDSPIYIRVRKSDSGYTRYINSDTSGILTSSGFSSIVAMTTDTIVEP